MLTSTSPSSGQEGDILTIKGHALSLTASENVVTVGGQPCEMLTAANDGSFSAASCPVTSCTLEMRTQQTLTCRLPHLDAFAAHTISVGVLNRGVSPALSSASITYASRVRSFEPSGGSVAGGTLFHLYGDGLSDRLGDIDVQIANVRCAVYSVNVSHVSCVTGAASDTSQTTTGNVVLSVRGSAASCSASPCTYQYDSARTSRLTGATVLNSNSVTQWTTRLTGSGFLLPSSRNTIMIGRTPCTPIGSDDSATQITCTSVPPLSGYQVVTLENEMGTALGVPTLPLVKGIELTLGRVLPSNVSLAGGLEMTLEGAGFSATDSKVTV